MGALTNYDIFLHAKWPLPESILLHLSDSCFYSFVHCQMRPQFAASPRPQPQSAPVTPGRNLMCIFSDKCVRTPNCCTGTPSACISNSRIKKFSDLPVFRGIASTSKSVAGTGRVLVEFEDRKQANSHLQTAHGRNPGIVYKPALLRWLIEIIACDKKVVTNLSFIVPLFGKITFCKNLVTDRNTFPTIKKSLL